MLARIDGPPMQSLEQMQPGVSGGGEAIGDDGGSGGGNGTVSVQVLHAVPRGTNCVLASAHWVPPTTKHP